jgi:hypothetical protein
VCGSLIPNPFEVRVIVSILAGRVVCGPMVTALVLPGAAWMLALQCVTGGEVAVVAGKLRTGVLVAEPFPGGYPYLIMQ